MLRRIALRGFKSFADPIALDLGPGVNVIVGPNGSGKSNLAEAVLWALGEQRSGRLRAGAMGDVLFSGGPGRGGAPLAEVSLTLEAGGEATGAAEVESTRRLTRAGDADYRLNGSACRLLDVQEALASCGLGPDALAIVRQGQVEALCTSRPSDRRAIVDEAAGVAVHKRRRRRAEQKLSRVATRLDRARDLAGEVRARARALERQARAAERALALDVEIAAAAARLTAARALAAAAARDAARAEATRLGETARAHAAAVDAARAARAAAADARAAASGTAGRAEDLAQAVGTAHERLAGRAELAAERVGEAAERRARRQSRRAAARARLGELESRAAAARADLEATAAAVARTDAAAREAEEADGRARAERRAADETAAAAGAALAAAEREVADAGRRRERIATALEGARRAVAASGGHAADEGLLARAERREAISAARVARWADRAAQTARAASDAAAERTAADARAREARADAQLLAPPRDDDGGGTGTLGAALAARPGHERAVAAALGALAEAVLAPSLADGAAALEGGAAAAVVPAPAPPPAAEPPPGARPLLELVEVGDEAVRPHLERLLGATYLVHALDDAANLPGATLVTPDGLSLRTSDGVLTRPGAGWARRALHRRAVAASEVAARAAADAAGRQAAAQARASADDRRRRAAERAATRAAARLASERARAGEQAALEERARAELGRLTAEERQLGQHEAEVVARVERLRRDAEAARVAAGQAREAAAAAEAGWRAAGAEAAEARAAAAAAERAAAEVTGQLETARRIAGESGGAERDLSGAERAARALAAAAQALRPARDAAREGVRAARAEVATREAALRDAERAVEAAERAAAEAARRAQEARVTAAVAEERALEAGEPPPDVAADALDLGAVGAALADLEARRAAIGAVNPLAAREREELAEREGEMVEQVADLERAAAALRGHLGELDASVEEGFDALFTRLSANFSEVIELLFPGGRGRLRAVCDADGEAGIEVEVVPAGKQPRSLGLLSGGERSLVALAFCLALAMARPAPFYLLDEVEAALDDVNLRRFLGVVRRLADRTQFLLITHQQPTVEMADTLFGVTMGADGASQVLARRLRGSVEGPARPYVRRRLQAVPGGRSASA